MKEGPILYYCICIKFRSPQLTRLCFRDRPEASILRHLSDSFDRDSPRHNLLPSSSPAFSVTDLVRAMDLYFAKDSRRAIRLEMLNILGRVGRDRRSTYQAGTS